MKTHSKQWQLYILKCADGSLYTGITNNLERRLAAHKAGKGAKYTRGRAPLKLVYTKRFKTKSAALKAELQIKSLTRAAKLKLIDKAAKL